MNQVVAKFQVNSVENFGRVKTAKLSAVYDTDGANKDFTKYTPSGSLSITIETEAPASEYFIPGEILTLTFSK